MPKVVTQRCLEQDLNPRPTDCKPKCLTRCTTAPPLVIIMNQTMGNAIQYISVPVIRQDALEGCYGNKGSQHNNAGDDNKISIGNSRDTESDRRRRSFPDATR